MSTTQTICETEMWQPEPQKTLVERMPVEERRKLVIDKKILGSVQGHTWEDLRGLSLGFEEEWF